MPIQALKSLRATMVAWHLKRLAELSNEAERVGIAQFLHEEAGVSSSTKHVVK